MNPAALRLQNFLVSLPQNVELKDRRDFWGKIKSLFANPMKLKYTGIAVSFIILTLIVVPNLILPQLNALHESERMAASDSSSGVEEKYGDFAGRADNQLSYDARTSDLKGAAKEKFSAGYPVERYRRRFSEIPKPGEAPVMGRSFTKVNEISAGTTVLGDAVQTESLNSLGYVAAGKFGMAAQGGGLMGMGMGVGGMGGMGQPVSPAPSAPDREGDAVTVTISEAEGQTPSPAPSRGQGQDGDVDGDGVMDAQTGVITPGSATDQNVNSPQNVEKKDKEAGNPAARKIIRNANMQLEVKTLSDAQSAVDRIIAVEGGLVAQVTQREKENPPWAQYSLWIPAEKLDSVIEQFKKLGETQSLEVSVQDIGEQYFDQETRIKNLQRQEERLLKLYDRDTVKMEELLKVEQEIARVRTEIEQMQGRQRLWDRQIRYSTLNLNLVQKPELEPIAKSEPEDVFSPVRRAFKDAVAVILYSCSLVTTLAAWIFSFAVFVVPWAAVVAILWFGGKRLMRR